jgi:hypothetical protein
MLHACCKSILHDSCMRMLHECCIAILYARRMVMLTVTNCRAQRRSTWAKCAINDGLRMLAARAAKRRQKRARPEERARRMRSSHFGSATGLSARAEPTYDRPHIPFRRDHDRAAGVQAVVAGRATQRRAEPPEHVAGEAVPERDRGTLLVLQLEISKPGCGDRRNFFATTESLPPL